MFQLWGAMTRQWFSLVRGIEVRAETTTFGCALHTFLTSFGGMYVAWLLVCMTVERMVSIFLPHKAKVRHVGKAK